jgi:site-specific recombinase XerD
MTQSLGVIANGIDPGATADTLDWSRVGYADVARVRSELASKYAPSTANKCLAALRGVMRATFRLGLIDSDSLSRAIDVKQIRGQRAAKGRALESREIGALIGACDRTSNLGIRNAALVAVGFGCGLRRAELVGLDLADLLDDATVLRVRGKGNKQRLVYLSSGVQALLAAWIVRRGAREGALFCAVVRDAATARRLAEQTVYDVLRALCTKAEIDRVSPHDLRRTFVSTLLDQGVQLSTVAAMAGHADVSTTAKYDRRGERIKKQAAELLQIPIMAWLDLQTVLQSGSSIRS